MRVADDDDFAVDDDDVADDEGGVVGGDDASLLLLLDDANLWRCCATITLLNLDRKMQRNILLKMRKTKIKLSSTDDFAIEFKCFAVCFEKIVLFFALDTSSEDEKQKIGDNVQWMRRLLRQWMLVTAKVARVV